jgi:hypothetical protein
MRSTSVEPRPHHRHHSLAYLAHHLLRPRRSTRRRVKDTEPLAAIESSIMSSPESPGSAFMSIQISVVNELTELIQQTFQPVGNLDFTA